MVLRRDNLIFPEWFFKVYSGDYALQLLLTQNGDAGQVPGCMATVRKHAGGVSQIRDEKVKYERQIQQHFLFVKYID